MHTVAVLALDQVIPFDLSTPIEAFTRTRLPDGRPGYQIRVCAERPETDAGAFRLRAPWGLEGLKGADTVIVPGTAVPEAPLAPAVRTALRDAAAEGTRIASLCSGTFPLAASGLLDGLRATTHWIAAERLAAAYPHIDVDPDVLYVDNGQILTSAGAAAGLDLCLHMIRRDYGSAVAADTARLSVMPLEREGGQAQFIVHDHTPAPNGSVLEPVLAWLRENLARELTLDDIAAHAGISSRTLIRRFRQQTGTTPLQWLHRARIRQAQHLLETTPHSVERIGAQVGFGSPTAFRDQRQQEFEELAPALSAQAKEEPGTRTSRWFAAGAGSYLVPEEYTESAAAMAHQERAAELLARVGRCAEMVYAELYGPIGPEIREWVRSHPQASTFADFPEHDAGA